jgi:tRNA threonylcarbamoyladenosine biosynthesis protein TsaB
MRVLALDTTTPAGTVALVESDRVIEERGGDASRSHAERLPGELLTLLQARGLELSAIDLFAVASGPGSFTGLRIGIATIQGLAFVHHRPVAGISALEALAQFGAADLKPGTHVAAWMDAHRHEVFSALYRVESAAPFTPERLEEVEPAAVGGAEATLARWADLQAEPAVFVGGGACLYRDVIEQRSSRLPSIVAPPPLAGIVGRLALAAARRGGVGSPAAIRPLYVRRPDAEIARAARA